MRLLWLLLFSGSAAQSTRAPPPPPCTVAAFGAVADNRTDNTAAFRAAAASSCDEIVVGLGVWLTGPFNLSSNTVLRVEGTISGSTDPRAYPVVTLLPVDESFRAPWKRNRQRQALVAAYSATNVTVTGSGTIDGNGWPWWRNQTAQGCRGFHNASWRPDPATQAACLVQRPKLLEFVDCEGVVLRGASAAAPLTLRNSPFWTFHPVFCRGVRAQHVHFRAPRDHGNTDGIDPDSCDDVHVADCLVDVGDDAISVKSGRHWKTGAKVAAQNYLFERVVILFRNFAIGSAVSGDVRAPTPRQCHAAARCPATLRPRAHLQTDPPTPSHTSLSFSYIRQVRNITFRDGVIGDDLGSSPWAIKIKTDSQEGGVVDGVYFRNVRIGNITYCGSSRFVFTPPHAASDACDPARPKGATMLGISMGYASLAVTDPGTVTNIVFDGIYGMGPTGSSFSARGLPSNATADRHIVNVTLRNFSLATGGPFQCDLVDGLTVEQVGRWPSDSTCKKPGGDQGGGT
jgi:polygalacturonase